METCSFDVPERISMRNWLGDFLLKKSVLLYNFLETEISNLFLKTHTTESIALYIRKSSDLG